MKEKKVSIRELTEAAWSILEESEAKVQSGEWSAQRAEQEAIERIKDMRYGSEHKDYFWITNMKPIMIAHPYLPELNGRDLSNYKASGDRRIFIEFADMVRKNGEGYLQYRWQWKDDSSRIVPKLSYVKGFEPWGWIVGTGIYLDGVEREINDMKDRLNRIALSTLCLSATLLSIVIFYSLQAEKKRAHAEWKLRSSYERYKALVSASKDGMLLVNMGTCVFMNDTMKQMLGIPESVFPPYSKEEFAGDEAAENFFRAIGENQSVPDTFECRLKCRDGSSFDALLLSTNVQIGNDEGLLIQVKNIEGKRTFKLTREHIRNVSPAEEQCSTAACCQPLVHLATPATTCPLSTPLPQAASMLKKSDSQCLIVTSDTNLPIGIITRSDFVLREESTAHNPSTPLRHLMSAPLISLPANSAAFEAATIMVKHDIKRIVLTKPDGSPEGIVASKHLLQLHSCSPAHLITRLSEAETTHKLKRVFEHLPSVVTSLVEAGLKPRLITRVISKASEIVHRRVIENCLHEAGSPPGKFTFLLLGSQGRMEETVLTDQDNALIYENPPENHREEFREWFLAFGKKITAQLNEIGFPFCKGEIMASNPKWNAPLQTWINHFTDWIRNASPDDLLKVNIFFDYRCIFGDKELEKSLTNAIRERLPDSPQFFNYLADNSLHYKPPVGRFFGNLQVSQGENGEEELSLKEAIKPIINFSRLYALKNNIDRTGTLDRLEELYLHKHISKNTLENIQEAHSILMEFRLRNQVVLLREGLPPSNDLIVDQLSESEVDLLKHSLQQIQTAQSKISFDFKGSGL